MSVAHVSTWGETKYDLVEGKALRIALFRPMERREDRCAEEVKNATLFCEGLAIAGSCSDQGQAEMSRQVVEVQVGPTPERTLGQGGQHVGGPSPGQAAKAQSVGHEGVVLSFTSGSEQGIVERKTRQQGEELEDLLLRGGAFEQAREQFESLETRDHDGQGSALCGSVRKGEELLEVYRSANEERLEMSPIPVQHDIELGSEREAGSFKGDDDIAQVAATVPAGQGERMFQRDEGVAVPPLLLQ